MPALARETIDRLKLVSTATLTTQLFKRGLRNAFMQGVRPLGRYHGNLVGPAFTLRNIPAREDVDNVGVFSNPEKHLFETSDRIHPMYFSFAFEKLDDITIDLPLDWKVSSLPAEQKNEGHVVAFSMSAQNDKGTLHLRRKLDSDIIMMESKFYLPLRAFYQTVRSGDDAQIVLQPGSSAASN